MALSSVLKVGEENIVLHFPRGDMGRIIGKAGATRLQFVFPVCLFVLNQICLVFALYSVQPKCILTFFCNALVRREIEEKSGAEVKVSFGTSACGFLICLQVAESGEDQCEVTITGPEKARGRAAALVGKYSEYYFVI